MNYTPQPLMAPMIGLIIAVIWGLSTDYEVFLVSRMVEARERGMSTAEAIRIGTATTGRLITGAALVLAVVAGAFVFSDLVMMKYLAFGLLIALLLDATVVRMFLVPAVMKLLGDDCWWAPRWMKRLQERLGLGETELPDERKRPAVREPEDALVGAGAPRAAAAAAAARPDPSRPPRARRGRGRRADAVRPRPPARPARRRRGHHADAARAAPRAPARAADRPGCPRRPAATPSPAPASNATAAAAAAPRRAAAAAAACARTARSSRGWATCAATVRRDSRLPRRRHRPPERTAAGAADPTTATPSGRAPTPARQAAEPTTAIPAQRPSRIRTRPRSSTRTQAEDERAAAARRRGQRAGSAAPRGPALGATTSAYFGRRFRCRRPRPR